MWTSPGRAGQQLRGGQGCAAYAGDAQELAPSGDAVLHEPARGRARPGGLGRCNEAEHGCLTAQRRAQDGLVELAGPLVVVEPPAQHHDQALGRGHLGDEPGVRPAPLLQRCPEVGADRSFGHAALLLPQLFYRESVAAATNSSSMNSAAWRSWACWKWA